VIFTGAGAGTSWTDPNNWEEETTLLHRLPAIDDLALVNNTFTVNVTSAVNFVERRLNPTCQD
jgi:hypothetical protein